MIPFRLGRRRRRSDPPWRICHVHLLSIMSGPQRWTIELFKNLPRDRYQPSVLLGESGDFQRYLEDHGVATRVVPSLMRGISLIQDAKALFELAEIFARESYDLVHTHSSKPGILARLAARLAGIPAIVHHVHGFAFHEFSSAPTTISLGFLEGLGARLSDRVVFVNDEERLWAERWNVVPRPRAQTVYNGADLTRFNPARRAKLRESARRSLDIEPGQVVIAYIGRLWEQKHPQMLVPTIAELLQQYPGLDPILLVAGDGHLAPEVESAARICGVDKRVRLLGWRKDVAEIISAADAIFLPSLWEGLPLTLIEAACLGVPAVATDIKGNREVVVNGKTGLLIPPRDHVAAALALGQLLHSRGMRGALGNYAAERGRGIYDVGATASRIEDIYGDLLEARPSPKRSASTTSPR